MDGRSVRVRLAGTAVACWGVANCEQVAERGPTTCPKQSGRVPASLGYLAGRTYLERAHPDVEWYPFTEQAEGGGAHRGHEGVRQ